MPVAEISVSAVSQYTVCPSGTISWATIYEAQVANADSYYWKHDGEYCKLMAEQVGSAKYVTLWRSDKDEKRYLKPHKDDDSGSKYDWGNDRYTGGYLYKQDVGTSGGTALADGTYTAISSGSVADEGEMYKAIVTITVKNGKVTTITAKGPTDPDNLVYFNKALNGIINSFVGQSAIPGAEKNIDSVSGATKSYRVITDAIGNALNGNLYQEETGGGDDTQSGNGLIPDGTYTKTSTTSFNKDSETYKATVTITVTGGVVTSVTASGPTKSSNNIKYFNKAVNGIKSQLVNETADSSIKNFDSVSSATKSSQLIRNAVQQIVSENITSSSSSTKTYYVLTSTLTSGKKYIIINRNSAGSGVALGSISDSKFSSTTLTVKSADSTISKPYIDTADTDTVYTLTGSFSSFKLKNQSGSFIKINDKKASVTSSESSATALKYASNKISYYDNSKAETRYIYYKSSKDEWKFDSSGTSLYFYEEYTPPAPAKTYTVKFYTYDGELIKSYTAEEGTYPSALLESAYQNPSRDSTDAYDYTFNGWTRDMYQTDGTKLSGLPKLTENVSYYQAFVATPRKYAVTWKNWDKTNNNETAVSYIEYGDRPVYPNSGTPEKADDTNYTYTFSGWSTSPNQTQGTAIEDLPDVTEAITYYACFTPNPVLYTVTWKNYDGVTLATESVAYGHMPSYTGATPTKPSTIQYYYTFSGWSQNANQTSGTAVANLPAVSGNVTYYACFSETAMEYTLSLVDTITLDLSTMTFTNAGEESGYEDTMIWVYPKDVEFKVNGVKTNLGVNGKYRSRFISKDTSIALNEENDLWFELTGKMGTTTVQAQVYDADTGTTLVQKSITVNVIKSSADVTWVVDGVSETVSTKIGEKPTHADPTKENTSQYTYTFSGWSTDENATTGTPTNDLPTVTGDITYYAIFTRTTNTYTVTWKDYDGSVIKTQNNIPYGTRTAYDGDTPTREADTEYTYTFDKWNPDLSEFVTENKTYTATYSREKIVYTLSLGDTITLDLNDMTFTGADILSGCYDYNNDGKDEICVYPTGIVFTVNGTTTNARTEGKYGLRFVSEDKTIAEDCENDWWFELTGKQGTTTVHAQVFDIASGVNGATLAEKDITVNVIKPVLYADVTWVVDGNSETVSTKIGEKPTHTDPTKENTSQYTYTFSGWSTDEDATTGTPTSELSLVTGDITYYAIFTRTTNTYTVEFVDDKGTVLLSKKYPYGTRVEDIEKPSNPEKQGTAQYTYIFKGWSPEFEDVTKNITYTAQYSAVEKSYTVIWQNEDGTILKTDENVPYGTTPAYNGETPTKSATAQYTYTFEKWSPDITSVTGNVTYVAVFTSTVNKYTVIWQNENGAVLKTDENVPYGTTPAYGGETPQKSATAQYTYTFEKWSPDIIAVTGDVTYVAVFTSTVNKYAVIWKDENGTILETDENVPYGAVPVYNGADPEKDPTSQYSYIFNGWSPTISEVKGNITYTATYRNATNRYKVMWVDYDGTVLKTEMVDFGIIPEYNGYTPVRADDDQYSYEFNGWQTEIRPVEDDVIYMAGYVATQTGFRIYVEDYTKSKAVTSIIAEKYYRGNVLFTVEAPQACAVAVHNADDTYRRLYCTLTEDGKYQFMINVTDSDVNLTIVFKGDVTLDGRTNTKDTLAISRVSGRFEKFQNNLEILVGDVDGNGKINTKDTLYSSRVSSKYDVYVWDLTA